MIVGWLAGVFWLFSWYEGDGWLVMSQFVGYSLPHPAAISAVQSGRYRIHPAHVQSPLLVTPPGSVAGTAPTAIPPAQTPTSDSIGERTRVEQGIAGDWSGSNGTSDRPTAIRIIRTGDGFRAEYTSVIGPESLRGELQPDNRLRLVNERQYGKLVRPGTYYDGEFSQEAWVELGLDGTFVIVRFSQAEAGRALVLKRVHG